MKIGSFSGRLVVRNPPSYSWSAFVIVVLTYCFPVVRVCYRCPNLLFPGGPSSVVAGGLSYRFLDSQGFFVVTDGRGWWTLSATADYRRSRGASGPPRSLDCRGLGYYQPISRRARGFSHPPLRADSGPC